MVEPISVVGCLGGVSKMDELVARKLTAKERKQILVGWNDTYASYPKAGHLVLQEQTEIVVDYISKDLSFNSLKYSFFRYGYGYGYGCGLS